MEANNQTKLAQIVANHNDKLSKSGAIFKPNPKFYSTVGINAKRWGLLVRGDLEMSLKEIKSVSDFFQIPTTEFFN